MGELPETVRFKNRFALAITTTTPLEAMVEDLLFIRDILDAAGIEYLLVRGNDERPVIAVSWTERKNLRQALVEGCANAPFYSKTVDAKKSPALLVADGALSKTNKSRIFRLFRPRVHVASGMNYGANIGVQIELWSISDEEIVLPVENSLTRRTVLPEEAVRGTVERFGRIWPTIENMFADHASDISFDIDLVFSWVDGSSKEFQAQRAKRMQNYIVGEGDESEARFRQIDELKYALRSIHMYAPWIRRIFVATDSDRPDWLADDPRVTFMPSEKFFADPSVLPTHNSQAVECQLHHIPGLAEHFLYSNDDMFFGRPVGPDMFFSPGGISMFIEADTRIGLGHNDNDRSGFENAARVNRRLLQDRFGLMTTRHLEHAATPLRKSVMAEMEREFAEDFAATAASTFRASSNISVTNSLYHYYTLMSGTVGGAEVRRRQIRRYDGQGRFARHGLTARQALHGLLLPQRRQRSGDRSGTSHTQDHGVPGELLPHPGALGSLDETRAQPISAGPLLLRSISVLSHAPVAPEWAVRDCHANVVPS